MKVRSAVFHAFVCLALCVPGYAAAELIASFQAGAVYSARNDVALPGDTGSELSLCDDLDSGVVFSPRIEAGYLFADRHYAGVMVSLLRLDADGTLDRNIMFDGKLFPAGTDVTASYRFDSYRATYRYLFLYSGALRLGAGITGKIRDAEITLEGGGQEGGLSNTGFVPLLNFYLEWVVSHGVSLLAYGDAAWSPYGRAEDVFAGLLWRLSDSAGLMAGYRLLEGGADNDTVYTFSTFHYAVAGVEFRY